MTSFLILAGFIALNFDWIPEAELNRSGVLLLHCHEATEPDHSGRRSLDILGSVKAAIDRRSRIESVVGINISIVDERARCEVGA